MTYIEKIEYYEIRTLGKLIALVNNGTISIEDAEIIAGILLDC